MASDPRMEALLAEARYARERYQLYNAKVLGDRPTRLSRLRELERVWERAEARLRHAQAHPAAAQTSEATRR